MSTRCNVIIKDESSQLVFYRHSDGYPSVAGKSLEQFVDGYTKGIMRLDVMQSAGWLIIQGHNEYKESSNQLWKVGAYEPTDALHGDIDFLYTIDLQNRKLSCNQYDSKIGTLEYERNF